MRTNVEIDDELISRAMALTGKPTKKAVVEEALSMAVRRKRQEELSKLFGNVQWEGDLDEMRASRFPEWDAARDAKASLADASAA